MDKMMKMKGKSSTAVFLLRSLLISYLVTGGLLLLLALFLYRFQLSEAVITVAIILIYIAATFLAGFLTGKKMGTKKYLWGLAIGAAYFVVMVLISLLVNHTVSDVSSNLLTTFMLCGGAGMLGGMLS